MAGISITQKRQTVQCMSIRRTQQTVQSLWRSMEGQLLLPQQQQRALPPQDPETGQGGFVDHAPTQFAAAAMQPPRLQQVSCCGRLLAAGACCICLLSALVGAAWLLQLPAAAEARAGLRIHLPPPPHKPLPAILRRYGVIRRASRRGRHGVDPATLRTVFPHWWDDNGLAIEAVAGDLALGLAAVVEQLDPAQELHVVNGRLSTPLTAVEPPLTKGESEEETEL